MLRVVSQKCSHFSFNSFTILFHKFYFKVMKSTQKKQICHYDTHETALIEIGQEHVLERVHKNTVVGNKLEAACENVIATMESAMNEDASGGASGSATVGSALMKAATAQCQKENAKSFGTATPPLNIQFLKRWINQGTYTEDDAMESMETVDARGEIIQVNADRFENVLLHRPELLLPRCALFEGDTMKQKRHAMRSAIRKALKEGGEDDVLDKSSNEDDDVDREEEKDNGGHIGRDITTDSSIPKQIRGGV